MKKILLAVYFLGLVGCGSSENEKRQAAFIEVQKEQIKSLDEKLKKNEAPEKEKDSAQISKEISMVAASEVAAVNQLTSASNNEEQDSQNNLNDVFLNKMGSPEMASCTAAALKAGQGVELYRVWAERLTARYTKIYPNKSPKEIEEYVDERVTDKKHRLESKGIDSPQAFYNYYQMNCVS